MSEFDQVLERINAKVHSGLRLEEVMDFVYESISGIIPRDRMGLALLDEGGRFVTSRWGRTEAESILLEWGYTGEMRGSSLERILETGEPRIINDLVKYLEERPLSHSTRLIVDEGMRSSLTVPLKVDDRPVGFLFASSREVNAYREEHIEIIRRIIESLSQAVEKAYLLARLETLNQNYLEMIRFVAHELKSPLANVISQGMLLSKGYLGKLEEKQIRAISRMLYNANFMTELISHYLNLSRVEREGLAFEPQESIHFLAEVLEPVIEIHENAYKENGSLLVKNFPKDSPIVECDPSLMQIVCSNLIGNAVKYGSKNCRVEVNLTVEGEWLVLSVWNEGVGFKEENRHRLFKKFSRLKEPGTEDRKGTGLGLYLTYLSVLRHGGGMTAESEHGKWARFTVKIPIKIPESIKARSETLLRPQTL